MKIEAFIFDLDGVLVYTDQYHYNAWSTIAKRLHIPFGKEVNNRLRGVSRIDSLKIILEGYTGEPLTAEEQKQLADEKNELYRQMLQGMSASDVSDEVLKTLQTLKDSGYLLAVGSSSKNAKLILEKTGLSRFFNAVSDGTNITAAKPNPEVFLKAAEFLNVPAENCAVVEDAVAGIDAAKVAGMMAVGIGDAYKYEKTDYPIQKMSDIMTLINSNEGCH